MVNRRTSEKSSWIFGLLSTSMVVIALPMQAAVIVDAQVSVTATAAVPDGMGGQDSKEQHAAHSGAGSFFDEIEASSKGGQAIAKSTLNLVADVLPSSLSFGGKFRELSASGGGRADGLYLLDPQFHLDESQSYRLSGNGNYLLNIDPASYFLSRLARLDAEGNDVGAVYDLQSDEAKPLEKIQPSLSGELAAGNYRLHSEIFLTASSGRGSSFGTLTFRLSEVPEPAALPVVMAGAAMLARHRRRKV